jgi:hypothetical protein
MLRPSYTAGWLAICNAKRTVAVTGGTMLGPAGPIAALERRYGLS